MKCKSCKQDIKNETEALENRLDEHTNDDRHGMSISDLGLTLIINGIVTLVIVSIAIATI